MLRCNLQCYGIGVIERGTLMKCKNVMITVLVSMGSLIHANPMFEDCLPNLGTSLSRLNSDFSAFIHGEEVKGTCNSMEVFLKNFPAARQTPTLNGGFADLENIEALPAEGILPANDVAKGKIRQVGSYLKSLFSSKSVAANEQEKKSFMTQIKENPGTAAAITAGSLFAFYTSYKLIEYFDHKKAKKIALQRRLKDSQVRPVVFERIKKKK